MPTILLPKALGDDIVDAGDTAFGRSSSSSSILLVSTGSAKNAGLTALVLEVVGSAGNGSSSSSIVSANLLLCSASAALLCIHLCICPALLFALIVLASASVLSIGSVVTLNGKALTADNLIFNLSLNLSNGVGTATGANGAGSANGGSGVCVGIVFI